MDAQNEIGDDFLRLFLVFDSKIVQHGLEIILHQQAGVTQIAGRFAPFFEATVIEHFMPIVDDEGDDPEAEALLEQD